MEKSRMNNIKSQLGSDEQEWEIINQMRGWKQYSYPECMPTSARNIPTVTTQRLFCSAKFHYQDAKLLKTSSSFGKLFSLQHVVLGKCIIKRFERNVARSVAMEELKVLKNLHHQYIVPAIGAYFDGAMNIVMPNFLGTVRDYVRVFDDGDVIKAAYETGHALDFIHSRKIVHGGVQPTSIAVDNDSFKLTDFANAKLLNEENVFCEKEPDNNKGLNIYHDLDAIKNKRFSKNTDLWGLMCVLFYMNQKQHPLTGEGTFGVIKILEDRDVENGRVPQFEAILTKSKFFNLLKLLASGTSADKFVSSPEMGEFRKQFAGRKQKQLPELSHSSTTIDPKSDIEFCGTDLLCLLNKASFYYEADTSAFVKDVQRQTPAINVQKRKNKVVLEALPKRKRAIPEPSSTGKSTSSNISKNKLPIDGTRQGTAKPRGNMDNSTPRDKPDFPKNKKKPRPKNQKNQVSKPKPKARNKKPCGLPEDAGDDEANQDSEDDMIFACLLCMQFISDNELYLASHAVVCSQKNKTQFKVIPKED